MGDRLVLETPCEHGFIRAHGMGRIGCSGGARRVLDARPPDYEAAARVMWNDSFGEPWNGALFAAAKLKVRREAKAIVDAAVGGGLIVEDE